MDTRAKFYENQLSQQRDRQTDRETGGQIERQTDKQVLNGQVETEDSLRSFYDISYSVLFCVSGM